jgi:hypothetical protein
MLNHFIDGKISYFGKKKNFTLKNKRFISYKPTDICPPPPGWGNGSKHMFTRARVQCNQSQSTVIKCWYEISDIFVNSLNDCYEENVDKKKLGRLMKLYYLIGIHILGGAGYCNRQDIFAE